jgi:hypothetical protein
VYLDLYAEFLQQIEITTKNGINLGSIRVISNGFHRFVSWPALRTLVRDTRKSVVIYDKDGISSPLFHRALALTHPAFSLLHLHTH